MSGTVTRRVVMAGTAMLAMQPWSAARARYPFCHALKMANFAPPEMTFWIDAFQSEVRMRIAWEDGLNVLPGTDLSSIREAAAGLATGALEMCVIHSSWVSSLVPDFTVLSDPRVGQAVARPDRRLPALFQLMAALADNRNLTLLGLAWNFDFLGFRQDKTVSTLADLKGLKIGARGSQTQAFVSALGGQSAAIPSDAIINALTRGQIDGAVLSAHELERAALGGLSLVSFGAPLQPAQGYVMLINRQLLQRVDESARRAFFDGGRAAANLYQQREGELRDKVLTGSLGPSTKVAVGPMEVSSLQRELIPILNRQYEDRKVSPETLKLVSSFGE